jgi:hypothetical protein
VWFVFFFIGKLCVIIHFTTTVGFCILTILTILTILMIDKHGLDASTPIILVMGGGYGMIRGRTSMFRSLEAMLQPVLWNSQAAL